MSISISRLRFHGSKVASERGRFYVQGEIA